MKINTMKLTIIVILFVLISGIIAAHKAKSTMTTKARTEWRKI